MNKVELVANVAEKTELSKKEVEKVLTAFIGSVEETLVAGEKIHLVGLGTFEVVERAERQGRNPKTGEAITIPASKTPKLKISKTLKDAINA